MTFFLPVVLLLILFNNMITEKRERLYSNVPVKLSYIAISRLIFLLSPLILIQLINVITIFLGSELEFHKYQAVYAMQIGQSSNAGAYILITVSIVILLDIFHSLKRGRIFFKMINAVIFTGIFILIGIFIHDSLPKLILDIVQKTGPPAGQSILKTAFYFIVPNVYVIYGIILAVLSVCFYRMRRSYV